MVGLYRTIFGVHGTPLDNREDVALHPFARDLWAMSPSSAGHLVDLVDKDDAALLGALACQVVYLVHVHESLGFLLNENLTRIFNLDAAPFGFFREQVAKHIF